MISQRPPGGLPSQPKPNPKESAKAITLGSGKGYVGPIMPEKKKVTDDTQPFVARSNTSPSDGNLEEKGDERKEEPTVPKVPM